MKEAGESIVGTGGGGGGGCSGGGGGGGEGAVNIRLFWNLSNEPCKLNKVGGERPLVAREEMGAEAAAVAAAAAAAAATATAAMEGEGLVAGTMAEGGKGERGGGGGGRE